MELGLGAVRSPSRSDPILAALCDSDLDILILDSTQALGRTRGGFGTKVRASVDGLGHPVELILTAAHESDIVHAEALLGDVGTSQFQTLL